MAEMRRDPTLYEESHVTVGWSTEKRCSLGFTWRPRQLDDRDESASGRLGCPRV